MLEMTNQGQRKKGPILPDTKGPGPERLIGYWQYPAAPEIAHGYFGRVQAGEGLPTATELRDLVGLTTGTAFNEDTAWLKFFLDGKVLYIPAKPLTHSVSRNALTPTAKQITYGEFVFNVRLIRAINIAANPHSYVGVDAQSTHGSEWNRTMYHVSPNNFSSRQGDVWDSLTAEELGTTAGIPGSNNLCLELWYNGSYYCQTRRDEFYYCGVELTAAAPATYGWRPLLELVGRVA